MQQQRRPASRRRSDAAEAMALGASKPRMAAPELPSPAKGVSRRAGAGAASAGNGVGWSGNSGHAAVATPKKRKKKKKKDAEAQAQQSPVTAHRRAQSGAAGVAHSSRKRRKPKHPAAAKETRSADSTPLKRAGSPVELAVGRSRDATESPVPTVASPDDELLPPVKSSSNHALHTLGAGATTPRPTTATTTPGSVSPSAASASPRVDDGLLQPQQQASDEDDVKQERSLSIREKNLALRRSSTVNVDSGAGMAGWFESFRGLHARHESQPRIERIRRFRRTLEQGVIRFNKRPKDGVNFLVAKEVIEGTADNIAEFLLTAEGLSKAQIGNYLGGGAAFNISVMYSYVHKLNFAGMDFDTALRTFLSGFRLPGEAQKIDRMMEKFAERYCLDNPGVFAHPDNAYLLSYSLIMLNTDAHSAKVKNKMTKKQFLNNVRDLMTGGGVTRQFLEQCFRNITTNEIKVDYDYMERLYQRYQARDVSGVRYAARRRAGLGRLIVDDGALLDSGDDSTDNECFDGEDESVSQSVSVVQQQRQRHLRRMQSSAVDASPHGFAFANLDSMNKLAAGNIFLKHGRRGKPHRRKVWLSDDRHEVCWQDSAQNRPVKALHTVDVTDVLVGRDTSRQLQRGSIDQVKDTLCFSIVTPQRTLDLEGSDPEEVSMWVRYLTQVVEENRLQRQQDDEASWRVRREASIVASQAAWKDFMAEHWNVYGSGSDDDTMVSVASGGGGGGGGSGGGSSDCDGDFAIGGRVRVSRRGSSGGGGHDGAWDSSERQQTTTLQPSTSATSSVSMRSALGKLRDVWKQGIPPAMREHVWPRAIGNELGITRELFSAFRRLAELNHESYLSQERASSAFLGHESSQKMLMEDLPRTLPELTFLHESGPHLLGDDLRLLLQTYLFYRPDIGYMHGMSHLAAMLLLYLDLFPAFVCLANLVHSHFFLSFYRMDVDNVRWRTGLFARHFERNAPKLHAHFAHLGVSLDMFFFEWCLTLYAKVLPLNACAKVWDRYLLEGESVIYRVGLALLCTYESQLLRCTFQESLLLLTTNTQDVDQQQLWAHVDGVVFDEAEFTALVSERTAHLRRL